MRLLTTLLLACAFFLTGTLHGQHTQRITQDVQLPRGTATYQYTTALPFHAQLPFFSFFVEYASDDLNVAVSFSVNGTDYTDRQPLLRDVHNPNKFITELFIGAAEYRYIRVYFDRRTATEGTATLHFYHPGSTPESTAAPETMPSSSTSSACPCPLPEIESRSDWCPSGDCPQDTTPTPTDVSHLIVHHSAGTNTASDWAAVVRAIWDLHVMGNGWDDVGYNYLVDPNGVLYEGRGNDVLGAHFCGTNTGTMGVCVMGNFTDIAPAADAVAALERLLAWKSCDIGADPLGESFHASSGMVLQHISGHRDGCATQCPGDSFYPLLPGVRTGTNDLILSECAGLAAPISLEATEVDATSYFLNWVHNSADESGFQLERSEDNGDSFSLYAELGANTLSFVETGLELERIYQYRIRAYNEIDTSAYSNIVIINTGVVDTRTAALPVTALTLSPNPVEDVLHLDLRGEWTGDLQFQLLDLQQRPVLIREDRKGTTDWTGRLDMGDLPAGIYLLNLEIDGRRGVWRVVKQ